jgi:hypothetical protein
MGLFTWWRRRRIALLAIDRLTRILGKIHNERPNALVPVVDLLQSIRDPEGDPPIRAIEVKVFAEPEMVSPPLQTLN